MRTANFAPRSLFVQKYRFAGDEKDLVEIRIVREVEGVLQIEDIGGQYGFAAAFPEEIVTKEVD